MSNYTAADMTTAAASGHRDGYQAGYADAVKAFETAQPAAAQEAVAWQVGDDFYTSESLAIEGIQQWGPSGAIARPLYAAPTPAAPGIDHAVMIRSNLRSIRSMAESLPKSFGLVIANIGHEVDHAMSLIDASTKGSSETCTWEDDGEGNWHTACGDIFTLMEGSPADNKMHHCPYCGKNLMTTGTDVCVAVIGDSYEDTRSEAHDAARYRWLRNHYEPSFHDSECDSLIGLHGEDLDDAIDDEMQATSAEVGV